jgi:dihydrofolate synthase/folylpolyglutamate synthase
LIQALSQLLPEKRIIFILGMMQDKDHPSILKEVCRKAKLVVLTKPDYKRAAEPGPLKEAVKGTDIPVEIIPQIKPAYLFALKMAESDEVICITGSHFTVGQFLRTFEPQEEKNR